MVGQNRPVKADPGAERQRGRSLVAILREGNWPGTGFWRGWPRPASEELVQIDPSAGPDQFSPCGGHLRNRGITVAEPGLDG